MVKLHAVLNSSLFSFLQAFDRRPWTVNEQIKIIQDFLDVSADTIIANAFKYRYSSMCLNSSFMEKCRSVMSGRIQAIKNLKMQRKAWRSWS
jgi:hypothetical protein